jgi:hypothetical protein
MLESTNINQDILNRGNVRTITAPSRPTPRPRSASVAAKRASATRGGISFVENSSVKGTVVTENIPIGVLGVSDLELDYFQGLSR